MSPYMIARQWADNDNVALGIDEAVAFALWYESLVSRDPSYLNANISGLHASWAMSQR